MNTQAIERSKQRVQIRFGRAAGPFALIEGAGDLIQIPPDRADLGNAALEHEEFGGWERRYKAQV